MRTYAQYDKSVTKINETAFWECAKFVATKARTLRFIRKVCLCMLNPISGIHKLYTHIATLAHLYDTGLRSHPRPLQRRTPKSFARDSYVKKKGQGYECLYCRKVKRSEMTTFKISFIYKNKRSRACFQDITKTIQMHCVECKDDKGFVMCVQCFW